MTPLELEEELHNRLSQLNEIKQKRVDLLTSLQKKDQVYIILPLDILNLIKA